MPYRKKRRWIRLKRSVNAVIDKRLATNVLHLRDVNPQVRSSATAQGQSGEQRAFGSTFTMFDYVSRQEISAAVNRMQPEMPGVDAPVDGYNKYVVVGWMMNIIIRNVTDTPSIAYLDCYYWRAKRDVPSVEFADMENMWANGFDYNMWNTAPVPKGSPLDYSDVGATPWANPAMRKFVEIYKKTRIRLGQGQDTELSLRSSRSWYNNGEAFNDAKSMIRGVTQGILVVFHGGPNKVTNAEIVQLSASRTRTVYYKVLQNSVRTAGESVLS